MPVKVQEQATEAPANVEKVLMGKPMSLEQKLAAAKEKSFEKVGYKKGEPFKWRSKDRLEIKNRNPGWGYRWITNDPESIEKRQAEGFLIVNEMTGIPGDTDSESDGMQGSKKHRELTLAAIPEELKSAMNKSVQEQTDKQTAGLKEALDTGLSGIDGNHGGSAEGKITIE